MEILFFILAAVIVVSAVLVVALPNPIYSAIALIGNMLTVAGIFAMLDAHFLAVVQIIVYAGAVMVLVIFVLMLLNLKMERPHQLRVVYMVVSVGTGMVFLSVLVPLLNSSFSVFPEPSSGEGGIGTVQNIGELLFTRYVFPFEAASVLIMAAIVGAVLLAKRKYRFKDRIYPSVAE